MGSGIPEVKLSSGRSMPCVGMGTASYPPPTTEEFRSAIFDAIAAGYRHFDTAAVYGYHRHFDTAAVYSTEQRLGEAVGETLRLGLVKSRDELFITSKLWCSDAHPGQVLPALRQSLQTLQLAYLDLYLVHWPLSLNTKGFKFPVDKDTLVPMDINSIWEEMEECLRLGLVRSIGISNFSCKKMEKLLSTAKIPPSVNQVELHPVWQQKKLLDFCKEKGIHVSAYSPLGAIGTPWGTNLVMESEVLREIAEAKGKSVAQISLRWIYEQGAGMIFKTFMKERMIENISIFDWELSNEDLDKINQIQQVKGNSGEGFISATGPFKSVDELWDGEI